jgi:hypothetical protein
MSGDLAGGVAFPCSSVTWTDDPDGLPVAPVARLMTRKLFQ